MTSILFFYLIFATALCFDSAFGGEKTPEGSSSLLFAEMTPAGDGWTMV